MNGIICHDCLSLPRSRLGARVTLCAQYDWRVDRPVLNEGTNCWRVARTNRAAFIIDGEHYFRAVYEAIRNARHVIFIVGWDVHSEIRLTRDEQSSSPETLRPLLDAVARNQPDLDIYILSWDFAMIYAMEREFFPQYKLRWKSHDRVHFCLDGEHPIGASQHQKVVVVDDRVAFSGGLDLSKWRWDTSEHRVEEQRRTDPSGDAYPPFHDVQMAVDGEAARALGELARDRWRSAAGAEPKKRSEALDSDPWPSSIEPTLTQVDVAIARTLPTYGGREEVREVERLYVDAIAAARRFIYIENQYLSSHLIGEKLANRLREPEGPEVIVVAPEETGGWLEQHTMDVLRARLLQELREADEHDRLRVYVAQLSKKPLVSLMIHAKVMIVDDIFVRVASSNLSNRFYGARLRMRPGDRIDALPRLPRGHHRVSSASACRTPRRQHERLGRCRAHASLVDPCRGVVARRRLFARAVARAGLCRG